MTMNMLKSLTIVKFIMPNLNSTQKVIKYIQNIVEKNRVKTYHS